MKRQIYAVVFKVTETCQNGNERKIQKTVYMPRFDENNKHITIDQRVKRGIEALKAAHYYNIEYVKTTATEIIFA